VFSISRDILYGMNWGTEKKTLYISGVVIILLVVIGVPVYFKYFNRAPSCFDQKLNQDEKGIDCGGVCALLCPDESRPPIVSFQRLYKVNLGSYTALALVENSNQAVFSRKLDYVFKIYDKKNVLLFEVPGTTFIPPARVFPIFASPILTGNREAAQAIFEITSPSIPWEKGTFNEPDVSVSNVTNEVVDTRSRIGADIINNEVYPIKNIPAVAIVYDEMGNAKEASATVIDYISPKGSTHITFTWNQSFTFKISKINIIPRPKPREWAE